VAAAPPTQTNDADAKLPGGSLELFFKENNIQTPFDILAQVDAARKSKAEPDAKPAKVDTQPPPPPPASEQQQEKTTVAPPAAVPMETG